MQVLLRNLRQLLRRGKFRWLKVKHVVVATYQYFMYVCNYEDHDWDFAYMLNLIQWKARKMSKALKKNNILANTGRVAKQLDYLVYLIDRYYEEDHNIMERDYYSKYPPLQVIEEKQSSFGTMCRMGFESEEAEKTFREVSLKAAAAEDKIRQRIFRHMERYVERWWD